MQIRRLTFSCLYHPSQSSTNDVAVERIGQLYKMAGAFSPWYLELKVVFSFFGHWLTSWEPCTARTLLAWGPHLIISAESSGARAASLHPINRIELDPGRDATAHALYSPYSVQAESCNPRYLGRQCCAAACNHSCAVPQPTTTQSRYIVIMQPHLRQSRRTVVDVSSDPSYHAMIGARVGRVSGEAHLSSTYERKLSSRDAFRSQM